MIPNQNTFYPMYTYEQVSQNFPAYVGPSSGQMEMSYEPTFASEGKDGTHSALSQEEGDGGFEDDGEEEEREKGDEAKRSLSTDSLRSLDREGGSPKKKPRVTLARGGACVACR